MIFDFRENEISEPAVRDAFRDIALLFQKVVELPVYTGPATPEGAITAGVGSIFLRTDGGTSTTLYVKESGTGNTGWVAK